ncbi:triose-phosphate isomerase [Candidatus Wolfebacteria bacterium]|nr:triose-phosphate isomerase [Candidatus Wolfebacteria bacterium]
MKKIIIFNWKSNPANAASALKLARLTEKIIPKKDAPEIVIMPPFVYLNELKNLKTEKLKNLKFGAQNVFWENPPAGGGSYTGEISAKMLKNLGVEYAIVGHSERRRYLGETDEMINKKVLAALKAGLKAVLCVGEDLSVRRRGKKAVENYIKKQLEKDLKGIHNSLFIIPNSLIVAYEPVWAIGAKHSDTPQDAVEIIKFIKQFLITNYKLPITKVLYGGSVDSKNIAKFLEHPEIDGALVGHASLKAGEARKIIKEPS